MADLGGTDLIIEAATEKEAVKHAIFEGLKPHLQPHTILTSNTSSISITRLAARTDRPEKFMGFHFMNPVPVMQLVELIRGIATDKEPLIPVWAWSNGWARRRRRPRISRPSS